MRQRNVLLAPQAKWKNCHEDPEQLSHVLLEVQRLWPPFLGGYRICREVSLHKQEPYLLFQPEVLLSIHAKVVDWLSPIVVNLIVPIIDTITSHYLQHRPAYIHCNLSIIEEVK